MPPWNNLGLPWHRSHEVDRQRLVRGNVAELTFDLQPTATRFNAGHRIRVTIMGADADNTEPPVSVGLSATIEIHRGPAAASRIELPVMTR